jgi:signal transduction histidine kinase
MKLFHKIFLCFITIYGITFLVVGYLLINFAYGNAIGQEKKIAYQEFQYNRYILQSILYSDPDFFSEEDTETTDISSSFTVPVAVYGIDGTYIFSNMAVQPGDLAFEEMDDDRLSFRIYEKDGRNYIFVCDYVSQSENRMYLITQTDISEVIDTQKNMIDYFQKIYIVILCISFPVIFLLTNAVTAPIKKVGKAARRIAGGEYSERINRKGNDEISELAGDFNLMAEQVEEKITELSDVARQKEDFAANFAHELKTPLTSVIGYADMLYQRNLPREEVKSAAEYILNEGMRLEVLSLKLMDLFVLGKQNFALEEMAVKDIFEDLRLGIEPVCRKFEVRFHMKIENGIIKADYDLFKTMMLNLEDNSIKADCKDIWISGKEEKGVYWICVKDNGKGIPPEELGRITEAFYMVDKSRSRKQHGAGLGMALVSKIVEIHRATMKIESDGKTGTEIHIAFPLAGGETE